MIEERILGKYSCEGCRRLAGRAKSALVAETWAPSLGNTSRENAFCGEGEVIANAAMCRKKR